MVKFSSQKLVNFLNLNERYSLLLVFLVFSLQKAAKIKKL